MVPGTETNPTVKIQLYRFGVFARNSPSLLGIEFINGSEASCTEHKEHGIDPATIYMAPSLKKVQVRQIMCMFVNTRFPVSRMSG